MASINERHKPVAFLHVSKAEKVKAKNKNVAAQLGDPDDDPKSGPYYAACLSFELGQMIADAMKRGEHIRPQGFTLHSIKNWLEKLPRDETAVMFHEWRTHDFRRCHVTLSALAWGSFGDVAEAHGQASELTARRYFQWGLAMKRSEESVEFELNL